MAEFAAMRLKGDPVIVDGMLVPRRHNADGIEHFALSIRADSLRKAGSRSRSPQTSLTTSGRGGRRYPYRVSE
jgi:single-stranded DNA-binding protein